MNVLQGAHRVSPSGRTHSQALLGHPQVSRRHARTAVAPPHARQEGLAAPKADLREFTITVPKGATAGEEIKVGVDAS